MNDTIFVLNGPNLNLLGTREPRFYGNQTLADIEATLEQRAKALKLKLDIRQSNHEGVLVDWLNEAMAKASAVIINGGAYAHTSIAIRDAIAALAVPVIEVHMTNVYAREHFRRQSMIAQVAKRLDRRLRRLELCPCTGRGGAPLQGSRRGPRARPNSIA